MNLSTLRNELFWTKVELTTVLVIAFILYGYAMMIGAFPAPGLVAHMVATYFYLRYRALTKLKEYRESRSADYSRTRDSSDGAAH